MQVKFILDDRKENVDAAKLRLYGMIIEDVDVTCDRIRKRLKEE